MVARRSSIQMVRDRYAPRYERTNPNPRYTRPWQEDRAVAAGGLRKRAAGGGKSELRRAVCRITSGTWALRLMDGQCHRKDTASATPLSGGPPWKRNTRVGPACRVRSSLRKLQRRGKGEMVR